MNKITLTRPCPFCGKSHSITVDQEEFQRGSVLYRQMELQSKLLRNCFPNFTHSEREFIKTGICPTCCDSPGRYLLGLRMESFKPKVSKTLKCEKNMNSDEKTITVNKSKFIDDISTLLGVVFILGICIGAAIMQLIIRFRCFSQ